MHSDTPAPRRILGRNALLLISFFAAVILLIVLRTQGWLRLPVQQGVVNVTRGGGLSAGNRGDINGANQPTQADERADEKAIRKVLADQESAWNKGDLEAFMIGYWNSPELSFYSGRDKNKGWQQTLARYKQRYQGAGKEMGQLAFSEVHVESIAAGVAIVRGRWALQKKSEKLDGLFTLVVKKLPEGWRIVHDHTSIGEPPPATKPMP